jgi:hypothetical protein
MFTPRRNLVVFSLLAAAGLATYGSRSTNFPDLNKFASARGLMNTSRANAASVLLKNGKVLIIGGTSQRAVVSTVETYDSATGFRFVAAMAYPRTGHGAALLPDGRVLVAGGRSNSGAVLSDTEIYDPVADAWMAGPDMLSPHAAATVSVLKNGRILIAGGDSGAGASNRLELFNPATSTFSSLEARLSSPRMQHAAAVLEDGTVLIGGGSDGENALDTVDRFDPATNKMTLAGRLSIARLGLSATTLLSGRVIFAGGNTGKTDVGVADVFDPRTAKFAIENAYLSTPRSGHTAIRVKDNNTVLFIGGTSAGKAISQTEAYVPWRHAFQRGANMTTARSGAMVSAMSARGKILAVGGQMAYGTLADGETQCLPTITTDKLDYAPGTPVTFTGTCWVPGGHVTISMREDPYLDQPVAITVQVDNDGNFSNSTGFAPDIEDLGTTFYVTATEADALDANGNALTAQTTFTDGNLKVFAAPAGVTFTLTSQQYSTGTCAAGSEVGGLIVKTGVSSTNNGQFGIPSADSVLLTAPALSDQGGPFGGWSGAVVTTDASVCITGNFTGNRTQFATFKATPVITWINPAAITYGTLLSGTQLNATADAPGSFVYSPVSGTLLGAGSQTLSTVFTPTDTTSFVTATASVTLTVNPKQLAITGVTVSSKTYDGNNSATLNTTNAALSGVVPGDTVTLNSGGATGVFPTKSVGTGLAVTVSGFTISGAGAGNYVLAQPTGLTASINAKGLTIGGVAANSKTYDGNNSATLNTTNAALSGVVPGDTVTLNSGGATGVFPSKSVGTGLAVTVSGFTFGGIDAGNYTLAQPTGLTADINAKGLSIGGVMANSKTYDGNNSASLNTTNAALSGVVPGDTVTLNSGGGTGTFPSKSVGTGLAVTVSGFTFGGIDAGNYTLAQPTGLTADINAKSLTIGGVAAIGKTYDGNNSATLNTTNAVASGVVPGDTVTLNSAGATGTFPSKSVGSGLAVTVSGFTFGGLDAGNYTLQQPVGLTADINGKGLTIGGVLANSKTYDGNNSATLNTTNALLSGVVPGDTVTLNSVGATGTFPSKSVGTGLAVTVSGFTFGGIDAGNYTLQQPVGLTADINGKGLTIGGVLANSKTYDGNSSATLNTTNAALSGVVPGDTVTLNSVGAMGTFPSKNIGTNLTVTIVGFTITGTDAANYTLTQPAATASITQASVTATFSAADKPYDTTTNASVSNCVIVSGKISSDDLTCSVSNGAFTSANAGASPQTVTATAALGGADSGNYTIGNPVSTTATISPAAATASVTGGPFTFDTFTHGATITTNPAGLSNTVTYEGSPTAPSAAGTYHVIVTITNPNYTGGGTGTIVITPAATTVTFATAPTPTFLGGNFTVSATATSGATPTYSRVSGPCIVGSNGIVSSTGAGLCAVQASAAATANYLAGSNSQNVTIAKATPLLVWSNPADIVYGTALGATQLNASASTGGSLTYTPPAGTLLNAGNQQPLAVAFIPADTTDYNGASASVKINVLGCPVGPSLTGSKVYTGSTFAWTTSSTSSTASLVLSTTIKATACPGGFLTSGKVTFGIRTAGSNTAYTAITGATNLPVGLVNPTDPTTGTANATVQFNIGNNSAQTYEIAVIVGGNYALNNVAYDALVTVAKPALANTINANATVDMSGIPVANGYLMTSGSALSDDHAMQFAGGVSYSKNGKTLNNPQGSLMVTFTSLNLPDGTLDPAGKFHQYMIKSTAISSLAQDPTSKALIFGAKGTLQDLTTGASIDGGGTFQVSVQPATTTAGAQVGVALFNSKTGGLWFASGWGTSGTQTVPQMQMKAATGIVTAN